MLDCHQGLSLSRCLPLPSRRDIVRCQADWSGRLLFVFQGERYAAKRQADAGRFEAGENLRENVAGRETFLEKGSPSPCPTLPKTFAGGPVQRWGSPRGGRAAAIPQSHVTARQEPECTAREGRDIQQGRAGAAVDRVEACPVSLAAGNTMSFQTASALQDELPQLLLVARERSLERQSSVSAATATKKTACDAGSRDERFLGKEGARGREPLFPARKRGALPLCYAS